VNCPHAKPDPEPETGETADAVDPNDTNRLTDQIKGQTTEHATPPRLEDEGQSGG
jgi:hypothetical protein